MYRGVTGATKANRRVRETSIKHHRVLDEVLKTLVRHFSGRKSTGANKGIKDG